MFFFKKTLVLIHTQRVNSQLIGSKYIIFKFFNNMQLLAQMQSLPIFGNRKSYSVPLLWASALESPTIELQGTQFYVGPRVLDNSP